MTSDDDTRERARAAADGTEDELLLVDPRGQVVEIPPEGSLWSLALGWRAIVTWRRVRRAAGVEPTDHLVHHPPASEDS